MIQNSKRGFTLIEVVIYIGLFGILMSGTVVAVYQLLSGGDRNQRALSIQEEGGFLSRKINWALSSATQVTNQGASALAVTRPDLGSDSPLIISGDGTTLLISRGGGQPVALNSSAFTVANVSFIIIPAAGGKSASVEARFEVQGTPFVFKKYLR